MEVEETLAAQAPSNVGQGKEIATPMSTVLAIWNVARAMVLITTAILPLDFCQQTTAAMKQATPMVSNIEVSYQYFYHKVWISLELITHGKNMTCSWRMEFIYSLFLQDVLMEVEDQHVAQAHVNVGKGKEIVTQMLTVLAIWNAVKAMVSMTTAKLSLDFRPTMTAAMNQATPMVSNIEASYQYCYQMVWIFTELKTNGKDLACSWRMKFISSLIFTGCADGSGGLTCCTSSRQCGQGEGDCDSDVDCAGNLKCGSDNCDTSLGFLSHYDCCYDPSN